jgi:GTPase involved in cell partitioning and DNA repair
MEYILLIVIILLLILQNTKNTQNSTSLRREINQLNEKLNNLHSLLITKKTPKTVEDKSAKAIIKIEVEKPSEVPVKATPSANLEAREEDYTPSYPKVISLSDKDASTIKDILRIAESTKDYSTLIKLRHKIFEAL